MAVRLGLGGLWPVVCRSIVACIPLLAGCSLPQKRQVGGPSVRTAIEQPLSPEETEGLMGEMAENWLYGHGMGETAITAGTIFLFPPYALYVIGNAALSAGGYEEVRITDALPEEGRDAWNEVYDSVAGIPGNVAAEVSGEDFRNRAEAKEALEKFMNRRPSAAPQQLE